MRGVTRKDLFDAVCIVRDNLYKYGPNRVISFKSEDIEFILAVLEACEANVLLRLTDGAVAGIDATPGWHNYED